MESQKIVNLLIENPTSQIPGNLHQPELSLPFAEKKTWSFTGGPHSAWGEGEPLAALDFAPPAVVGGCAPSGEFVTAVADGLIVRSEPAIVLLDLTDVSDGNALGIGFADFIPARLANKLDFATTYLNCAEVSWRKDAKARLGGYSFY